MGKIGKNLIKNDCEKGEVSNEVEKPWLSLNFRKKDRSFVEFDWWCSCSNKSTFF